MINMEHYSGLQKKNFFKKRIIKERVKEPKKSADVKPNQAVQKKGKKRTHKEVGEMEKRPKKSTK